MPQILPFRGIRYNEHIAGALHRLISPPYDVIDQDMYRELTHSSPYNVARLILAGPPVHGEITTEETYQESARLFNQWLDKGLLVRDKQQAFYIYEQDFETGDCAYTRTGLVALIDLAESGGDIKAHENTLTGPRADRLNHLRATKVNFGQIFVLYNDDSGEAVNILKKEENSTALAEAVDSDGIAHRVRAIESPEIIGKLRALLSDAQLLIADGHHRFETALNYMRKNPESPAARYCMMTLVSAKDPGLLVLPTHRLIRDVPGFDAEKLLNAISDKFRMDVIEGKPDEALEMMRAELNTRQKRGDTAFGIYLGDGMFRVASRSPDSQPQADDVCARLDVSILHREVLEGMLDIDERKLSEGGMVEYIKDSEAGTKQAISDVDSGRCRALFILNPPLVEDVAAVAAQGRRMPQKSTFFYPKVYTGLVMRALDNEEIESLANKSE